MNDHEKPGGTMTLGALSTPECACRGKENEDVFLGTCLAVGFAAAMWLVHIELVKGVRSSFWLPLTGAQWGAVAGTLGFYTILAFLIVLAGRTASRLTNAPNHRVFLAGAIVAPALIWAGLSIFRTDLGTMADVLMAGAFVVWAAMLACAGQLSYRNLGQACFVWSLSFLAGDVALVRAGHALFLIDQDVRDALVPAIGLGWTLFSGSMLGLLWYLSQYAINRRAFRVQVCAFFLGVPLVVPSMLAWALTPSSVPGGPNVLIITSDALRAETCSTYGGPAPTPTLDALAKDGALVQRSYSLAPWTVPSMFGLFASNYPPSLTPGASRDEWRAEVGSYVFDPEAPTLAESFVDFGGSTAAFLGNPLLTDRDGILRGIQCTVAFDPHIPVRPSVFDGVPFLKQVVIAVCPSLLPMRPVDSSKLLTYYSIRFLRAHSNGRFFLWLHYMDPHEPYDPPETYRSMEGPWPLFCPAAPYWDTPQQTDEGDIDLADEWKPYVRSLYEGEVTYMDDCMGRVLDELETLGLDDSTYVCFTSDHGEEFWEHGRFGHGQSLYDELVLVPLVFRGPDIRPRTIEGPVSAIDIVPTLADLAGLEQAPDWRGVSLADALRSESEQAPLRPCFAQATNRYAWPDPLQMIVYGDLKLIRGLETDMVEVFDLSTDASEMNDVTLDKAEATKEALKLLNEWTASFPAFLSDYTPDPKRQQELLENLRDIGYVREPE